MHVALERAARATLNNGDSHRLAVEFDPVILVDEGLADEHTLVRVHEKTNIIIKCRQVWLSFRGHPQPGPDAPRPARFCGQNHPESS